MVGVNGTVGINARVRVSDRINREGYCWATLTLILTLTLTLLSLTIILT
jgi:hypothetical protein